MKDKYIDFKSRAKNFKNSFQSLKGNACAWMLPS